MNLKKTSQILTVCFISVFLLTSISTGADKTENNSLPVLRIEGRDWGYPSPYAFYPRGPGYIRMTLIFDTLAWRDENGVIPWLAKEWQTSEDGRTWVLKLVENAAWQDGKPLDAEDVKFTFDYMKKFPHTWFDHSVIEDVKVINPYEVKFTLSEPYAVFTTRILSRTPIIPRHIWKDTENPYKYAEENAVVGSGPYILKDYNRAQGSYLYAANTNYFKGKPKVGKLIFVPTKTPDITLLKGDIDMARILKIDSLEMFKGKPEFKILTAPDYWLFRLVVNFNRPMMDNAEFRQALAYSINRPEMVERVAHGGAVAGTYGYISPASEWHNPNVADYPYNPTRAKKIFDKLNIKDTNTDKVRELPNNEKLSLVLLSDKRFTRAAEAVRNYLKDVGIKASIDSADVSTHDSRIREMKGFDLALTAHGGISGDLGNLTGGLPAIKGYNNKEFLRLARQQPYLINPDQRKAALFRIQKLIAGDVATISLYYLKWFHVYRPAVFDGWFYTGYGLPIGVQLLENKLAFLR
ncbi:MAG: peptide ABC transporter substrate-binding protein [Desulfobacterales bacterium]|nr:peptide ABC transporter substrate-binding protein [Desulfobacterales bacterium]